MASEHEIKTCLCRINAEPSRDIKRHAKKEEMMILCEELLFFPVHGNLYNYTIFYLFPHQISNKHNIKCFFVECFKIKLKKKKCWISP